MKLDLQQIARRWKEAKHREEVFVVNYCIFPVFRFLLLSLILISKARFLSPRKEEPLEQLKHLRNWKTPGADNEESKIRNVKAMANIKNERKKKVTGLGLIIPSSKTRKHFNRAQPV